MSIKDMIKKRKADADITKEYCDTMASVYVKAMERKVKTVTILFDDKVLCEISMDWEGKEL